MCVFWCCFLGVSLLFSGGRTRHRLVWEVEAAPSGDGRPGEGRGVAAGRCEGWPALNCRQRCVHFCVCVCVCVCVSLCVCVCVGVFVCLGAEVNVTDCDGRTPLHYASLSNRPATVKRLIGAGVCSGSARADVTVHSLLILRVVSPSGADLEARNSNGRTALHRASIADAADAAAVLLEAGENSNRLAVPRIANLSHPPAVVCLSFCRSVSLSPPLPVSLAGADPDAREKDGSTALHWAADKNNVAVMRVLLKHGAAVCVAVPRIPRHLTLSSNKPCFAQAPSTTL